MTRLLFAAVLVVMHAAFFVRPAWAVLYGSDTAAGIVYRIDDAGNALPWATGLNNPNALAAAPDGSLYVRTTATSDLASNFEVQKISPTGTRSTVLSGLTNAYSGSFSGYQFPDGLATDSHGNLFVANAAANLPELRPQTPPGSLPYGVWKVTPSGTVSSFTPQGTQGDLTMIYTPLAVATDRLDNLWVTWGSSVSKIANDAHAITSFGAFSRATSLAPDSHGNVFVARPPNTGISKFQSGNETSFFLIAAHLAIDSQDNLYAATSNGVTRIDSAGQQTAFSSTALNNLTFVVPEPSTLITLGLGLLAFATLAFHRRLIRAA